jgi:hypothetical protein
VRVKAAGINPGEAAIRTGTMADIFPSTFPSGPLQHRPDQLAEHRTLALGVAGRVRGEVPVVRRIEG